jgi:hypothetical protein
MGHRLPVRAAEREMTAGVGRRTWFLLALSCVFYAACALRFDAIHLPFCDEGWLASPGLNLIRHGTMETSVIEPAGSYLKGIDHYTYWIMPLYPLGLAVWFKLWGFGSFTMRSYSTAFGVVGLLGIFAIVRRLVVSDAAALLTVALTGTSLLFVSNGSNGRMDMMSAGLGFAALACYLVLRERSFTSAVLVSHGVLAMAVFSHPNALIHFVALLFLTVWFDRRKIRLQHLVLAAAPYLVGCGLWGLYIREGGVDLWRAQFAGNATAGGRDLMFADPFSALRLEVERRYAAAFGFGPGTTVLQHLQVIAPLGWIAGIVAALSMRSMRRDRGVQALLILALLCPAILAVIDGVKRPFYLIYVVPFAIAVLSAVLVRARLRWLSVPLIALQVAGLAIAMRHDGYDDEYLPAVAFLRSHEQPRTLILGPSEFGFQLGYDRELVDDFRLGYNSGKSPDYIVIDPNYRGAIDALRKDHPEIYAFTERRLTSEYVPVFQNAIYTIYGRRSS